MHGVKQCDLDFSASLLWAKARVTPLSGYTIPRSEISGAVLESRMCLRTVRALDREASMKPGGVIMLSDSKCTISAVDTTSRALKPFFHNRVAEIIDNMKEMKQFCPVEDIFYISGELNPADLATRDKAVLSDLGPGSFWQKGPNFLCSRRDTWPVSREFAKSAVPDDEVRGAALLSELRASVMSVCSSDGQGIAHHENSCIFQPHHANARIFQPNHANARIFSLSNLTVWPALYSAIEEVLVYSNSLKKVVRIIARIMKKWELSKAGIDVSKDALGEPSAADLEAAERIVLLSVMIGNLSKPLIEVRVAVLRLHRLGLIDEELQQASISQVGGAEGIHLVMMMESLRGR